MRVRPARGQSAISAMRDAGVIVVTASMDRGNVAHTRTSTGTERDLANVKSLGTANKQGEFMPTFPTPNVLNIINELQQ